MQLLPMVKKIDLSDGYFRIDSGVCIQVMSSSGEDIEIARLLSQKISAQLMCSVELTNSTNETGRMIRIVSGQQSGSERYSITCSQEGIMINGESSRASFYAVQTLLQIVHQYKNEIPFFKIDDYPDFTHRGFYHDITRGKVPTLDTLKFLVDKCAHYKINQLQLYVEHSFAFRSVPELWMEKDPVTADEILELDAYCKKRYIDLVPSMSTFGHLYELLRVRRFGHLNELDVLGSEKKYDLWDRMAHYTINPLDDGSLPLITSMIDEYLPLFSSKYFNICCDETFDLGKGKNAAYASEHGNGRLYVDFLNKIIAHVKSRGKTPMFWGDIVVHHPGLIQEIPKDTIYLNWGYSADVTEDTTATFAKAGVPLYVCPGVSGWSRFANEITAATHNIRKMVSFAKKYNACGILNTDWGDCGHVNFLSNSFHGLILGASLAWNCTSYESDVKFDAAVSSLEWNDFTGTIMSRIRELGSLCNFYHFGNIYGWVNGLECLWNKEEKVKELDFTVLLDTIQRAHAIRRDIGRYTQCTNDTVSVSYQEMVWSCDAVRWTLELLAYKKCREYGQPCDTIPDASALIQDAVELTSGFKTLWRMRNKESELKNVTEVFRQVVEKIAMLEKAGEVQLL
ncbi:MAG: beta-N-acetylhexosaminidase [Fibrobacterota bacterium]